MLIEFFVIFQIVMLIIFFIAFFTNQEILWAVSFILSAVLMITSYNIEILQYVFDSGTGSYALQAISNSYPWLMGINMVFFMLSLVLGIFDIFEKYGIKAFNNFKKKMS